MWIENNDKERVKNYLKSDIESNITNLTDISNKIHDTISAITRAAAGTTSGLDMIMTDGCRMAIQQIGTALTNLYYCKNYIDSLETREWIDDE